MVIDTGARQRDPGWRRAHGRHCAICDKPAGFLTVLRHEDGEWFEGRLCDGCRASLEKQGASVYAFERRAAA